MTTKSSVSVPASVSALARQRRQQRLALGSVPVPVPALAPVWEKPKCECGLVFQVKCGHGIWHWTKSPGDKWTCPACRYRRMRDELVPEIVMAIEIARSRGESLKLLTLTWILGDMGSENTLVGAKRRRLDLKHFVDWVRGDYGYFEYFKVAETHKSGAVHFHMLVISPWLDQAELSVAWRRYARGAFRIDIRAVGIKCPKCWPGRQARSGESQMAFERRRRRSMIIAAPGPGKCLNCGHRLVASDEEVATACAWETVKYLGKSWGDGWDLAGEKPNRVSRSKGWPRVPKDKPEGEAGPCEYCDDYHTTTFVGCAGQVEKDFPGIVEACSDDLAFYPPGGSPCLCWGEGVKWRRSKAIAALGLGDLVGRGPPE